MLTFYYCFTRSQDIARQREDVEKATQARNKAFDALQVRVREAVGLGLGLGLRWESGAEGREDGRGVRLAQS